MLTPFRGDGHAKTPDQKITECRRRKLFYRWFGCTLTEQHEWQGLQSIIAVTAKREIDNKVTEETRYFISSLDAHDPKRLERLVRAHWSIENTLHWVLDIAFDEDTVIERGKDTAR